jgi:hypothetical protein
VGRVKKTDADDGAAAGNQPLPSPRPALVRMPAGSRFLDDMDLASLERPSKRVPVLRPCHR